jgi:hypothetical protein
MTPPAAAAAPAVHPRRTVPGRGPLSVPPRPRRVSGPARRPARARPSEDRRARRAGEEAGLVLGLVAALDRLPRVRPLDRLIQGRMSIALVAFALIGIVTMQLGLLKLNAGIGRTLEHEALLQRENAALSIENSEMAAGDRVELQAGRLGMELISPGALRFLSVGNVSLEANRAAAALRGPAATASPGTAGTQSAGATGEGSSGAAGSEVVSGASGETSGEAAGATPTSSSSTTAAPAPEAATANGTTSSSASGEATAPAAVTGAAPASSSPSGQAGGAGEAAATPSAPTGGGATAPSG